MRNTKDIALSVVATPETVSTELARSLFETRNISFDSDAILRSTR